MTDYRAPLAEMRFALEEVAGLGEVARLPGCQEASGELVMALLEQAGRLASETIAPLNAVGDREKARLENGVVRMPSGFPQAYARFVEGGWNAVPFDPAHGGGGLPWLVAAALQEIWQSCGLAFGLCPLLTQGGTELLETCGTAEQKRRYLPKLVSGEWTATMNITEPQAGSDIGAARTRATREDGHYRISGQKIFITYGDHDMAENVIHFVIARTPEAPAGSRGLSLFLVPKYLPDDDGKPGRRNDLRVLKLEEKLGIHASPTCVMSYGEDGGAIGFLVGEENRGLEQMFTMMNSARLAVGLQGFAVAERAYQQARVYARERRQGKAVDAPEGESSAIIDHPDVKRMLATMKASTEAMRALIYRAYAELDLARRHPDEEARARHEARVQLLTPVVKAWCSDLGCEVASLGVQVHGGAGYVEESGAAQHLRDARITPIYEGTNGIQALDLVSRKLLRDEGEAMAALIAEMHDTVTALRFADELWSLAGPLENAIDDLDDASAWLIERGKETFELAAAGATPYLRLCGTVIGGWLLAKSALAAVRREENSAGDPLLAAKPATAAFYVENILPQASGLARAATRGSDALLAMDADAL
ncbi:MAG: acyl-CoA dehydrogenase [Kiloniellales bacterium]